MLKFDAFPVARDAAVARSGDTLSCLSADAWAQAAGGPAAAA